MRVLVLLLLLANVGFFAYHRFLAGAGDAAQQIAALQISPEKIRPVSATTVSAVTAAMPAPLAACAEWGAFTGPDIIRADTVLATLALPANAVQRRVTDVEGYWVHMPPQKNKAEVERKVGELKALGITEFFVVAEAGQWRNAISLGLFKTEAAAETELERLRVRGVRSAVVTRREKFLKQAIFYLRDPDAATVARLTELNRDFTGTEIKAGSCPAPAVK